MLICLGGKMFRQYRWLNEVISWNYFWSCDSKKGYAFLNLVITDKLRCENSSQECCSVLIGRAEVYWEYSQVGGEYPGFARCFPAWLYLNFAFLVCFWEPDEEATLKQRIIYFSLVKTHQIDPFIKGTIKHRKAEWAPEGKKRKCEEKKE